MIDIIGNLFFLLFVTVHILFDKKLADFYAKVDTITLKKCTFFLKKDKDWDKRTYRTSKIGFRLGIWSMTIISMYIFFDTDF